MILAGLFQFHEQKSYIKLGRFSSSFAEITDVKSLDLVSVYLEIKSEYKYTIHFGKKQEKIFIF